MALARAASTSFGDPAFDFVEEFPGDARFIAGRSVEGDGDTVCDGLLIPCQIRDDRVKGKGAEVPAEFRHVTALVGAAALEAGDEVAVEMEGRILCLSYLIDGGRHLDDTLGTPVGGFQRNDDVVGCAQCREADQGETRGAVKDEVIGNTSVF